MPPLIPPGAPAVRRLTMILETHLRIDSVWFQAAVRAAVALAAGFHASRLNGAALRYNQPDPVLPDIVICPVVLAESLLEAIGAAGAHRPQ